MSVSNALKQRRSVKHFDPAHKMTNEEFKHLIDHAILSPSAFNLQHWRIVRVSDPAQRQAVREAAYDQPQMTDASEVLVLCMDLKTWDKEPAQYWNHTGPEVTDFMVQSITGYYQENLQAQRDEGMRSCSILSMALMLMAQEMGYDSCPMDGFDFAKVGQIINMPQDHEICLILTIGKALQAPHPKGGQLSIDDVVLTDRF
jgi:nitroreductase